MERQQPSRRCVAVRLVGTLANRATFLGALGALIATGGARAASEQALLPDICSAQERARIVSVSEAQLEALELGDLDGSAQLAREMEASLSHACRSGLDRLAPARTRCSAEEKRLVLSGAEAMMEAAISGDLVTMFELLDTLEKSVSRSCWIAVNRPQHPALQRACTSSELDALAGMAGPTMRASAEMLARIEASELIDPVQVLLENSQRFRETIEPLWDQLAARLSLKCQRALLQVQGEAQRSPSFPRPPPGSLSRNPQDRPSFVHDHGGGTYSVTGVGACTPSGCMTF